MIGERARPYLRSALFVDFDNVFIRLKQQDEALARQFATKPHEWLGWLERFLDPRGSENGDAARRILVRRCYLNPKEFGKYRPYFIGRAFETIDCPALTAMGKTSADICMVLDMIDLLSQPTHFDEFIIMSADADFTPVLHKLRKCDRRTVVLATGPAAPAYTSVSDVFVRPDDFLEALGRFSETNGRGETPRAPTGENGRFRGELSRIAREAVAAARAPVPLATLAQLMVDSFPQVRRDWDGAGTFGALVDQLDLGPCRRIHDAPGYLYDPAIHTLPEAGPSASTDAVAAELGLLAVVKRVTQLTDVPDLLPDQYDAVFEEIAAEVNAGGFHLSRVSKGVRDRLHDRQMPIARSHVSYILKGIAFAGHEFRAGEEKPEVLARQFLQSVLNVCSLAQIDLAPAEEAELRAWITGGETAPEA